MRYLLDADWTISFLNGRPAAVELISGLLDDGVGLSVITCGEVYEGLLGAAIDPSRVASFEALVEALTLLAPDRTVARRYASLRSALRSSGTLIPDNDLWLAATALTLDLTIVTRDSHFGRVAGLKLLGLR